MKPLDKHPVLTASEFVELLCEAEKESGRCITYVWQVSREKATAGKLLLVCEARRPSLDAREAPSEVVCLTWPCSSHKSVLGAMYYLLLCVMEEAAAADYIAKR